MRYVIGLIGFPLGIAVVVYRVRVKQFVGDIGFAEKWFGTGGTYTAILLLGLLISFGSLMYLFGTLQAILGTILAPFFGS